jgi:hypothetical protein
MGKKAWEGSNRKNVACCTNSPCAIHSVRLSQDESETAALPKGEVHRYTGKKGRVEGVESSSSGDTFKK